MKQYMVDIDLPMDMNHEFMELIPRQRARINKLLQQGVIANYSLSSDRSRLWVTVNAVSEADVDAVLRTFPVARFIEWTIHELMFQQNSTPFVLKMSLN
ncbi:MAG TPA: hypothetical protein VEC36_04310 [Patescibacteria group bacterium]|nr:hypothetical protein [Patescibacteria group bacterium]